MMELSTLLKGQDHELTSLNWLNKPDVLTAVCAPLVKVTDPGGDPHRQTPGKKSGREVHQKSLNVSRCRDTDKVLDVILNVRYPRNGLLESSKPQLSFACMIFMAIESSPTKMLPVREIYSWIMSRFPFYKSAPSGWRNSIRHNLSLNKCFCKVEKSKLPRGTFMPKGSYWMVDPRYRKSLLAALKRTPYHPYHKYFPLKSNIDVSVEEDMLASLGSSNQPHLTPVTLHAIEVDHCYAQPQKTEKNCEIAEEVAIAHVEAELKRLSDQAYESEDEEQELVDELSKATRSSSSLNDSGYSESGSTIGDLDGANALLFLANSPLTTPTGTPCKYSQVAPSQLCISHSS
jgi:forkhead box protein N